MSDFRKNPKKSDVRSQNTPDSKLRKKKLMPCPPHSAKKKIKYKQQKLKKNKHVRFQFFLEILYPT